MVAFIFLLTEKLNFLASSKDKYVPAGNYMFKVNNRNTRARCETFVKLTIKAPERPLTRKNDGYSMRKNIWENNWIMKFSLSKVMRLFLPLNKFSVLVVDFEILKPVQHRQSKTLNVFEVSKSLITFEKRNFNI